MTRYPARPVPKPPAAASGRGQADQADQADPGEAARRWAMIGYLGVPFASLLPPLVIYLVMRDAPWIRWHAAQALNLALTVLVYDLSAVIVGLLLALDALDVALAVIIPVIAVIWLAALWYLARSALAAGRGELRPVPAWLCATIAR